MTLCRRKTHRSVRYGFSLIELIVVLILMALMAALATTSARGYIVRSRLTRAAEVVEQFDIALRREAHRRRRTTTGLIDRSGSRLIVRQRDRKDRVFQLPREVELTAIRFSQSTAGRRPGNIQVNSSGVSLSYALRLSADQADRWILIAGGTGQVVRNLDRLSIEALLKP